MPPLLRTFIVLLIAFPGAVLWFLGGIASMVSVAFLIMRDLGSGQRLALPISLAVALTGHLMQTFAGNLLGEAHHRMAASRIGQRLAWDAALDVVGIGVAGSGVALAPSVASGEWNRAIVAVVLLGGFAWTLTWVMRQRGAFLDRWQQENEPPPEFVPPGVDGSQEPSQADR